MGKRVRLTDESLNSYGFWIVNAGMDAAQYQRNPVLLHMHQRGAVIGIVKDIRIENGEITGELEFDEATELSRTAKKQWEFGSVRMVSVGISVIEISEDKDLLKPGQTRPTVTKCKLMEVSLVDIGANDNAIVLYNDGGRVDLNMGGENVLPLLNLNNKSHEMDLKTLALQLGLPETATEAEITAKINELKQQEQEIAALRQETEDIRLAAITSAVEAAISEHRLTADKKDQFISLGKQVGIETLKATLSAMTPAVKPSGLIISENGGSQWSKLSEVPADKLEALRSEQPETYKKLYKAEYGIDCEL